MGTGKTRKLGYPVFRKQKMSGDVNFGQSHLPILCPKTLENEKDSRIFLKSQVDFCQVEPTSICMPHLKTRLLIVLRCQEKLIPSVP
jgi:hypothetical protein